jgi:hypothetical protein
MNKSVAALSLLALAGCASDHGTPASLLGNVNLSDGVSRAEAQKIAEAYFLIHVGCGAFSGISDGSNSWVVEGKHGYAGDPIKGFLINKQSGFITSPIGPSYARPDDMLKQANPSVPEN